MEEEKEDTKKLLEDIKESLEEEKRRRTISDILNLVIILAFIGVVVLAIWALSMIFNF